MVDIVHWHVPVVEPVEHVKFDDLVVLGWWDFAPVDGEHDCVDGDGGDGDDGVGGASWRWGW